MIALPMADKQTQRKKRLSGRRVTAHSKYATASESRKPRFYGLPVIRIAFARLPE